VIVIVSKNEFFSVIVFVIEEKGRDRDRDWKKRLLDHDGNVII
jgi:hypothetical protein